VVSHPGPVSAVLPDEMRAAMILHARTDYPNEACGVIVGSAYAAAGGAALRFVPTRNEDASGLRYRVDAADLLRLTIETDDSDEAFWAIVHSHTHTEARPSPTDIRQAESYPDALYILVSLSAAEADPATGEPGIRAWRIVEGEVFEVGLSAA
jgi:[CysO sulfur-carrier protein]-S-L-cysteine hydrolase